MAQTCQSEVGRLQSVFIKAANDAFVNENTLVGSWKKLNYLAKPDFELALEEYAQFQAMLAKSGAELIYLPKDENVNPDSIYCRDCSIATDQGMILCRMGKPDRQAEPAAAAKTFQAHNIAIYGRIVDLGTVEGGDTVWLSPRVLAVGQSYRTNEEGILQLRRLLEPLNVQVITVSLPHYKGPSDVFHLMSILSPIEKDVAVVFSPLMPIVFRNNLREMGFRFVEVPEEEFESLGCNVLSLAPGKCLMVEGNPRTAALLEAEGQEVLRYPGREISLKGGGGPTCLTRPLWRVI